MNRYSTDIFKTGTYYEYQDELGNLIVHTIKMPLEYSTNYGIPPIPPGWEYDGGEWNNGFVIKRIDEGSKLVWIPVTPLKANGTIDGTNFNEKFGRRTITIVDGRLTSYDPRTAQMFKQLKSVEKYGGFYMTLYPIGLKENVFVSKECAQVCNVNTLKDINNIVNRFTLGSQQMSFHVPFGAEYDTLEQFVNSNNLHNLRDEMMKFVLCRTGKFPRFTEYGEWSQEYVKPGIKGTFQVIRRPEIEVWLQV